MIWLALLYIVFISFLTKYIFYGFKLFHILIFSPLNLRFYVFSLERNFHYESRNVETENLKVIKKLTLNMIKRVKKKEETINKLRIYNFFWKPATDPKMGERIEKTGKPINKLRLLYFFWKPETDPKKEETDQQTENLQLFLKIGNGPKKKRKQTQKRRNHSTN